MPELTSHLAELPLIAILRGLQPPDACSVGEVLINSGFGIIEVPLNSPQPFTSIEKLATAFGQVALIGAGTVMTAADVERVKVAGGQLIVTPHFDPVVVDAAKQHGLYCAAGVATPSEGFAALRAGADALKLFPAEMIRPEIVKAWRAVMANRIALLPVGGITPESMGAYWQAGATGFGLGSALYQAGIQPAELESNARRFVATIQQLMTAAD